jgi:hypothetical protein
MTKDSLQPRVLMIQETKGIARADPMRDPLSESALARPRSLRGNQTEATFAHERICAGFAHAEQKSAPQESGNAPGRSCERCKDGPPDDSGQ